MVESREVENEKECLGCYKQDFMSFFGKKSYSVVFSCRYIVFSKYICFLLQYSTTWISFSKSYSWLSHSRMFELSHAQLTAPSRRAITLQTARVIWCWMSANVARDAPNSRERFVEESLTFMVLVMRDWIVWWRRSSQKQGFVNEVSKKDDTWWTSWHFTSREPAVCTSSLSSSRIFIAEAKQHRRGSNHVPPAWKAGKIPTPSTCWCNNMIRRAKKLSVFWFVCLPSSSSRRFMQEEKVWLQATVHNQQTWEGSMYLPEKLQRNQRTTSLWLQERKTVQKPLWAISTRVSDGKRNWPIQRTL